MYLMGSVIGPKNSRVTSTQWEKKTWRLVQPILSKTKRNRPQAGMPRNILIPIWLMGLFHFFAIYHSAEATVTEAPSLESAAILNWGKHGTTDTALVCL